MHRQHDITKQALDANRKKELELFCKELHLRFKNLAILDLAFHHRSYSNENTVYQHYNNERLEFLGDSVLGLATAAFLYKNMENPEGDLSRIKSCVVSEETLARIAKEKMYINRYLVLGKGEELTGGREKKAILADAVEAVIGALYIDSGYSVAEKFVLNLIVPEIYAVKEDKGLKNYKSILQEFYQRKYQDNPQYELVNVSGPDHDRTFSVLVRLGNISYGPAEGKNKKSAEQAAAHEACRALGIDAGLSS